MTIRRFADGTIEARQRPEVPVEVRIVVKVDHDRIYDYRKQHLAPGENSVVTVAENMLATGALEMLGRLREERS